MYELCWKKDDLKHGYCKNVYVSGNIWYEGLFDEGELKKGKRRTVDINYLISYNRKKEIFA